ncbi:MAG TPA: PilZ domain-containing protein [Thermotogota bacterium]|nr:PilZ domain-containing protein [Thermotogota bacterium]HPJ88924.1 PilZ domain-containing protein [Thermotogota bacterium]HPR95304.1 PilZ domain-containing protein [Thermotogota bacterium]
MNSKKEVISRLLYLSHWETEMNSDRKRFSSVFMGKYRKALLFETDKLNSWKEIYDTKLAFSIFIPSMIISGDGRCIKAAEVEGLRNELLVRFMLEPENLRVRQQRSFKRFPVIEKARLIADEQEAEVIVKDISLSGIGILSLERIRAVTGRIYLIQPDFEITFHKIHEFTDYNVFQYGMKIGADEESEQLKRYLFTVQERVNSFNIKL